ncbi:MAG TPA: trimethylamine methyltransferase family protein [Bryobacteraceae bacterium]|nr:trimethylamine methyltransferase family protein [Bryobacteraceae bacterium]HOQ44682.1 trimethylamine methyltransferase family protein [Bryobacteraceae bacterium]HPQ16539.1 trimethylamine methyltransferase family protein [Bryobacteraceae bacterium]HPU71892.1 trimethylamine methyltransferase family protein [Bryobacteraceae bacterium]
MRPTLKLLDEELIDRIVAEARDVLLKLGVEIHNPGVLSLLADHGASVGQGRQRAHLGGDLIDRALKTVPRSFKLFDALGNETHDFAGDNVYFTPGSAAINILDGRTGEMRRPETADYVDFVKVTSGLQHIASQSTALIPADVEPRISDSYRLYLSLLHGEKPVVTGAFTIEAFEIMKDLQLAVRGSEQALREKPLTVFSCCPTAPIKWSDVTSQNLVDCARASIPVEFISMPLSGFMAPVTLVGSLVQQTAETLSGLVISQLANPGHPVLYGGSPAVFDVRYETTPMGAIETMMLNCANSEIGKRLGMPTQGYIALSDAKQLDAQAGLESGIGAVLAALSGINSVSGPGMLDFESCQSLEKLVVDNEICGMAYRLLDGIEPREDFPSIPLFEELLREKHLLIADHTRRYLRREITFPGPVIDRSNRDRWFREGRLTLRERASREVARLIEKHVPSRLPAETKKELTRLMEAEARRCGMQGLPTAAYSIPS